MKAVLISCLAIGAVTVAATLAVGHAKSERATAEYGRRLMIATVPNRLACASCHIDAGAERGELTLVNAIGHYPGDRIIQRINECVTRNMNAQALPQHGTEVTAMVAWLRFLADASAAMGPDQQVSRDPVFQLPDGAGDPASGRRLFEKRCADCHGKDGAGLAASRDPARGYLFPPLWGPESFPDASEMHDPARLARFIHAKMPLGRPDLDETQALDVAALILSQPRPHRAL
jgi:thiosulfate dehydrogenase